MLGMCAELINWFTELLLCILTPVCPEPQAAVRSGRLPALERSDLNVIQLTAQAKPLQNQGLVLALLLRAQVCLYGFCDPLRIGL